MAEKREGFVVWIETDNGTPPKLRGAAEWTRTAMRIDFANTDELARFFETCVGDALSPSDTSKPPQTRESALPKSRE